MLLFLVLLAVAVRLYWGLQPRVVWGDEPFYLWLGQSLLGGTSSLAGGYRLFDFSAAHFAPLFPLCAALIARAAQSAGLAAPAALAFGSTAIYVLAGALLVLPVYGIARRLAGVGAGLAAAALAAVSPPLASGVLLWGTMTEPLFLLLIASAWWGLLVAQQDENAPLTPSPGGNPWPRPARTGLRQSWGEAGPPKACPELSRRVGGRGAAIFRTDAHAAAGASAQPPCGTADENGRADAIRPYKSGIFRTGWGYIVAGASLGLAYLVRNEALVYLVAGLAALLVLRVGQKRLLVRTIAGIGLAVVLFAVLISPYLVVQYRATGRLQLTEEAGFAYTSMQGLVAGDTAAFDQATWGLDPASGEVYLFAPSSEEASLLAAIAADPRAFVRLLRFNVVALLAKGISSRLIPWPLAALAGLGLFWRPWNARRARGQLLLAASLAGPLSFVLFFIQERYLAGALIAATVWSGEGAAVLGWWLAGTVSGLGSGRERESESRGEREQVRAGAGDVSAFAQQGGTYAPGHSGGLPFRRARDLLLRGVPVGLIVLALAWQQPRLWAALHQTHSFQPGHLAAAAVLRAHGAPADAVVMSRYPAIAFHAGMRWAPTPAASWPEVEAYGRRHHARYLVVDAWEARLRPQLSFLLEPDSAPPGLKLLATLDAGAGPVVIYEFRNYSAGGWKPRLHLQSRPPATGFQPAQAGLASVAATSSRQAE